MENFYGFKKQKNNNLFFKACVCFFITISISSCSVYHQINKQAGNILLTDSIIKTGHIGIAIFEPANNKFWYQLNGDKYFVPASNTKLFTAYAAMKYLGDSIVGLRYQLTDSAVNIYPAADPSFLHPDFKNQPVYEFLKQQKNIIYHSQKFITTIGKGWAWDDYLEKYMVQTAELPMYGNLIRICKKDGLVNIVPKNIPVEYINNTRDNFIDTGHFAERRWDKNDLRIINTIPDSTKENYEIPMVSNWHQMLGFLQDTLHQKIRVSTDTTIDRNKMHTIFSQPTDSLLKPMLFNSDNFLAEQSLLMVSNQQTGRFDVAAIIDTLLKSPLIDIPQKPRWVDGSGLSRYNLFTPASFIFILNKIKNEFGLERLKHILPTGGEGTLKNYYLKDANYIFAKTGSMSNHASISGLMYTKKGKLLLFSVLADQFMGSGTRVRHAVERFLEEIREKY